MLSCWIFWLVCRRLAFSKTPSFPGFSLPAVSFRAKKNPTKHQKRCAQRTKNLCQLYNCLSWSLYNWGPALNSIMNLRVALLWGMTTRFASSSLPMPSSCGHSDEELCGQSDEALDMLQHGAMPKDSRLKAVPGMDLCPARKSLTQTGGKGRVACDFQTAGFTCLNWENLLLWWLPLGRNYHGWLALLVILAVLVLGGRFTKQTEPAKELELSSGAIDRQVNFWCNDMPAHQSVYFAMASSVLWLATMVDHPVYSEPEVQTLPINAVPWWILFMPAAICILLAGSSSSLKLLWLKAAIVTMTMATIGYVACESSFTTRVNRGHRYLIVSWAFLGVVLALCGLLLAPEAKVSSWLPANMPCWCAAWATSMAASQSCWTASLSWVGQMAKLLFSGRKRFNIKMHTLAPGEYPIPGCHGKLLSMNLFLSSCAGQTSFSRGPWALRPWSVLAALAGSDLPVCCGAWRLLPSISVWTWCGATMRPVCTTWRPLWTWSSWWMSLASYKIVDAPLPARLFQKQCHQRRETTHPWP